MNRFEREHVDGWGDALAFALEILERSKDLPAAKEALRLALRQARDAKNRDNSRRISDFITEFAPAEVALTRR